MKQFSKELGKVSITPKGDWDSSITNEKLDIVYDRRNNQAYIAKQDVPIGVDIDNREYWQPLNVSGYADNNFINLTAENENGTITAYESLEEAVATIFPINRRVGATLSFYNLNSDRLDRQAEFELWQFNSTDLANWENKDYWNNIYYNWNVFAGWYIDADALNNHVETPNVGQYAYVGSNLNDAILYQCRTNGTWTNTGIKVRNYISVVVSGNITIGENGNWFSNGEDTGIPATPAVDEQLDNIINKHESLSRTVQGIAATGGASTATNVTYNNDSSGLNAENAQDVIDEVYFKVNDLSNNINGYLKSFTFDNKNNYVASFNNVRFKKGQYARILVKTTPAISTNYNGNATNMTIPYPNIKITNGFGIAVVGPATEDNAVLKNFGYGSASKVPVEHTAEFTIYPIDYIDNIHFKEQVQQNTKNIRKITSNLNTLTGTSIEYNFSESTRVCPINTSVIKSGQYIKIKVKTTPAIDASYSGNATDMTQKFPSINIKNGVGEVIIGPAISDNGTVINLGYDSMVTTSHKAEFTVSVINSKDEVTLKEQIQQNTENIEKKSLKWLQEGILQSSTIDLINGNFRVPGYTTIIRDWGFIGDSLSSGEMECFEGQARRWIDIYEYSWGQQICRLCGSNGYNYSSGGQTAKGWITGDGDRTWNKAKTTKHQAYIIALGVNDSAHDDVLPGNVDTDVDMSDYNNNADTFAGNYAGIIQRIRSVSRRCIIFVVLMPRADSKGAAFNNVIKNIATKFTNVFIIDLSQLSELYKSDYFRNKYYMNNHLNAIGYAFTAYLFMYYIDALIQENIESFKDIALWNTNYTANPT